MGIIALAFVRQTEEVGDLKCPYFETLLAGRGFVGRGRGRLPTHTDNLYSIARVKFLPERCTRQIGLGVH
jgi:hypothetical protein